MILYPYARASTDMQDNSVPLQLQELKKFCEYTGHEMGKAFQDPDTSGYSVKFVNRDGGRALIRQLESDVKNGIQSGICSMKIDRMFRDSVDGMITAQHFRKIGANMFFTSMGSVHLDIMDSTGWLVFQTLLNFAEFERNMIVQRVSEGKADLKSKNKKSGSLPFGWIADKQNNICPTPAAIEIIKICFNSRYVDGLSLNAIADHLNTTNITTPDGNRFQAMTIKRILEYEPNEAYIENDAIRQLHSLTKKESRAKDKVRFHPLEQTWGIP